MGGRAGTALQAMKLLEAKGSLHYPLTGPQKKRTITYNYCYLNLRECSWQAHARYSIQQHVLSEAQLQDSSTTPQR